MGLIMGGGGGRGLTLYISEGAYTRARGSLQYCSIL